MRKYLLLMVILLNPFILFSQNKPIVGLKPNEEVLKNRIYHLEEKVQKFIKTNDSLLSHNLRLEKEIDYDENLLSQYNTLNNTTFTIISVLFAFFGIIVPLLGFFFVFQPARDNIKEAQKLLNDVEKNMDEIFSEYLKKNRNKLIDNALTQIENNNTSLMSNSINCLDTYGHEGYNDFQILRLIGLFKKTKNEDEEFFLNQLCNTENKFTTDFFYEYIKNNPTNESSTWPAIYAAKYNKEEFVELIVEYIVKSENLTGVCASIATESSDFLKYIYNNDNLVRKINHKKLISHMEYWDKAEGEFQNLKTVRQNSKLYKEYLKIKEEETTT